MEPLLRGIPTSNTIGDPYAGATPSVGMVADPERRVGLERAGPEPERNLEPTMKMIFIAGLMITLPAIVIMIAFFGGSAMWPALVSFSLNMLPFLVIMLLLRGRKGKGVGDDLGH